MAKTSESHPLQINGVAIESGGGEIGMTFCPGKKQPDAMSGAWNRDLALDMQAISAYGARALVTLMESGELRDLSVPPEDIQAAARTHDIDWYHLPIRDVSVPDGAFESTWGYAGIRLRRHLKNGSRIVLHCKGGLGRTGTIAARLLVELGEPASSAIARVRANRPGAIETREQEQHVGQCLVVNETTASISPAERMWGCILGGAIGDAFGYEVEFDQWSAIQSRFGKSGIQEPVAKKGRLVVSDDTQMTLYTLEGMVRSADRASDSEAVLQAIREAYLDWYGTQRGRREARQPAGKLALAPELSVQRAPGNTCLAALGSGGHGTPENRINDSKGCGGVMRVAPLGWLTGLSRGQVFEMGARAAALTHGHPTAYLASGALCVIIQSLMAGASLHDAVNAASRTLQAWPDNEETLTAIDRALKFAHDETIPPQEAVKKLGEGWIAEEALAVGLYAAFRGRSFREALAIAANHSGDSDSTASIAGQIWGTRQGLDDIPHAWVQSLDVNKPLTGLVGRWLRQGLQP